MIGTPLARRAALTAAGLALIGSTLAAVPAEASVAPAATPTAAGTYTSQATWANAVFAELNRERAANHLPALVRNTSLNTSARTHNTKMAQANTLSHQLSGEASLGARVTTAGYRWRGCGENIAWNGDRSQNGALVVQKAMYNETPPNDGHRRNILSSSFKDVGVSVIDDTVHGKVWLTTDFGQPA